MTVSKMSRLGNKFYETLELIKTKRVELGIDRKKVSTRALTNFMTKHSEWDRIVRDTIFARRDIEHDDQQ